MNDDIEIQKETVYARDESPSKLFGFTYGEWATIVLTPLVLHMLFRTPFLNIAGFFGAIAHFKYVKPSLALPDSFFKNMLSFYLRKHYFYRAAARDYMWRPPVIPNPKK